MHAVYDRNEGCGIGFQLFKTFCNVIPKLTVATEHVRHKNQLTAQKL